VGPRLGQGILHEDAAYVHGAPLPALGLRVARPHARRPAPPRSQRVDPRSQLRLKRRAAAATTTTATTVAIASGTTTARGRGWRGWRGRWPDGDALAADGDDERVNGHGTAGGVEEPEVHAPVLERGGA